jgi:beta-galactosidase
MIRPGVTRNLEQFVERGGVLLTTFFSGIVDENDHIFLGGYPGELRKLLGIHVEEFDPLTPEMSNHVVVEQGSLLGKYPATLWGELIHLEGAKAIGVFAEDYYAQHPALTVNAYGQGQAYYIATQVDDVLTAKIAEELCLQAHIAPIIAATEDIEVSRRTREDGQEIYFLLNHTHHPHSLPLPSGTFLSLLDDTRVEGSITIAAMDVVILLHE